MKVTALIQNDNDKSTFEQEFDVENLEIAEHEIKTTIQVYNDNFGEDQPRSLVKILSHKITSNDSVQKTKLKRANDQIKFLQNAIKARDSAIEELNYHVELLSDKMKYFANAIDKGVDAKKLFDKEVAKHLVIEYEIRVLENIRDKTPVRLFVRWIFVLVVNIRIKALKKLTL